MTETWTYHDDSWSTGGDIVGYDVEATDVARETSQDLRPALTA